MTGKLIRTIQIVFAALGGWIGYFVGGADGFVITLLCFVCADYVTGVIAAFAEKRVSSAVGFVGIARKVLIFLMIGAAHMLDLHVLKTPGLLRTAVIFYYISNEGISLLENAAGIGLPVPEKLRDVLIQLKDRDAHGEGGADDDDRRA